MYLPTYGYVLTYLAIKIGIYLIFFLNSINVPRGNFKNYATCHNLKPSLTITIDDWDQYFKKRIIFKSKNLHNVMCQILMDGWKSITSAWHRGCSCGVAY
jgi:hypothetical protein